MTTSCYKHLAIFGAVFLFFHTSSIEAQSIEEIRNSSDYIYGIGQGKTYQEADYNALDMLVSQISVRVESNFSNVVQEKGDSLSNYSESVVRTYTNVTLQQNRSKLINDEAGHFEVMRFMAVSDLDLMFANRKNKINEFVQAGIIAERELRIADALRNYYWAFVLLRSHPDVNSLRTDFPDRKNTLLLTSLPEQIERLFSGLSFRIINRRDDNVSKTHLVTLGVYYRGSQVQNFDFQYWNGDSYSAMTSVNDGLTEMELNLEAAHSLPAVKIRCEYQYLPKARWDSEMENVLKTAVLPSFATSRLQIPIRELETPITQPSEKTTDKGVIRTAIPLPSLATIDQYTAPVEVITKSINSGNPALAQSLFTTRGYDLFKRLFLKGKMRIIEPRPELQAYKTTTGVEIRNLPVKFAYRSASQDFIEFLNFSFDQDDKIDHLSFALSNKALSDITSKSDRFGSPEDKLQLISFIEDFKTAYALRRSDFLESVFANNALIIIGRLLKDAGSIEGMYQALGKKVEYVTLSKSEYLSRVEKAFSSNEYISLQFESTLVKKQNDKKIYGVQLEQHYYSSSYADKGYLFLMIDLSDSTSPKIYVRTWQPEKNPDGTIIGLENFHM